MAGISLLISCSGTPGPATLAITNPDGRELFVQPVDSSAYDRISASDTLLTLPLSAPRYYRVMDSSNHSALLYVAPGSETTVTWSAEGPAVTGSAEAENRFIATHNYTAHTPDSIKPFSPEWVAYQEGELARLDSALNISGLAPDFIEMQRLYYRTTFLNQRLNGVEIATIFLPGGMEKPVLADDYYDFLHDVRFDSPMMLSMPKWFEVVNAAFNEMEKQGFIPVSNDHYMKIHADRIGDPTLRSHYLVRLLGLALKKGYTDDFVAHLDEVRPLITDPAAVALIPGLESQYAEAVERDKGISRGTPMPDMTFNTVDGHEYRLSDFKGNIVILDFWFTGCLPCKAETPYFEQIARDFDGNDVRFISVSLDTGDQLYPAWQQMMRDKDPDSRVLGVNLPGGFTSPLLKQLNITGVPRIMLIDADGRIIDTHAKRPSDPKLREQLSRLLSAPS